MPAFLRLEDESRNLQVCACGFWDLCTVMGASGLTSCDARAACFCALSAALKTLLIAHCQQHHR